MPYIILVYSLRFWCDLGTYVQTECNGIIFGMLACVWWSECIQIGGVFSMQPLLYDSAVFFLLVSASLRFCFFSLFILLFSVFFFFVVGEQKNSFFNTCIFRLWSSCHVERRSNLYEPLNTYTNQRCRWLQQAGISDQKKIMNKIYNSHQPIFVFALPHFIFRMHCII